MQIFNTLNSKSHWLVTCALDVIDIYIAFSRANNIRWFLNINWLDNAFILLMKIELRFCSIWEGKSIIFKTVTTFWLRKCPITFLNTSFRRWHQKIIDIHIILVLCCFQLQVLLQILRIFILNLNFQFLNFLINLFKLFLYFNPSHFLLFAFHIKLNLFRLYLSFEVLYFWVLTVLLLSLLKLFILFLFCVYFHTQLIFFKLDLQKF